MSTFKVYEGQRAEDGRVIQVTVNGQPLHNFDQRSSSGFEWGYGGGGPHALAVSILCDYFEYPTSASVGNDPAYPAHGNLWASFNQDFVKKFPHDSGFSLTSQQIAEWIATQILTN